MDTETFHEVAGDTATRLTFAEARELLELPLEQRPRIYCLWHDQIVAPKSTIMLDKYEQDGLAIWTKTTTIHDMIRKA